MLEMFLGFSLAFLLLSGVYGYIRSTEGVDFSGDRHIKPANLLHAIAMALPSYWLGYLLGCSFW